VVLLSSDGSAVVQSPAVGLQLVTIAPPDSSVANDVDFSHTDNDAVKPQPDFATCNSRLTDGSTALDVQNVDKTINGGLRSNSNSVAGNGVSEALLAAVDAHDKSRSAPVSQTENTVDGTSSVPASPVNKSVYGTRRRRSTSSLPSSSKRTVRGLKRSTARNLSADGPLTDKPAADDNLPSFLSSMTDDD